MEVKLIQASSMEGIIAGYRECYQSQDKGDYLGEKDTRLITRALFGSDPKHDSPLEHCLYTWRVSGVSRALSHQLVRHRIASYSQRSQRYVSEQLFEYVVPGSLYKLDPVTGECIRNVRDIYDECMYTIQQTYLALVQAGVPKEDARMVLPNACATSLIVSMNPRAFRNFLKLRLDTHAQWEIRELAKRMLDSVPENHKFMYQDLTNEQTTKSIPL